MWFVMENAQLSYDLSDRLIRAISSWRQISDDDDDDVEDLISRGADVNRLHGTLLPLHCACMVQDSYCIRLLLDKGARVNAVDGYGRCALHYAAERDTLCVEILLEHSAFVDVCDGNRDTPLHWAAYKSNVACVKLLLQHGAEVDKKDFNNDTPLTWAARRGCLEVIKTLLQYNASLHNRNLLGQSPLLRAIQIQSTGLNSEVDDACLDLLINASGHIDLRDSQGRIERTILDDNRLCDMLLPLCKNPQKLQNICRYNVRKSLGYRYLPNIVPKLPIPSSVQEFVLLQR